MLNRSIPPPIHPITDLSLPQPRAIQLSNGMTLYVLAMGEMEIVKLDAVFWAGRPQEAQRLVAKATAKLVREGSVQHTGEEIAELMDFYGGTFAVPSNLDTAPFALFSLKKYFEQLLPVFADALKHPTFTQEELQSFRDTGIQQLKVDEKKNDIFAYRALTANIYGKEHPYGYNSTVADYEALRPAILQAHHDAFYQPQNGFLMLSGKVDAADIALVEQHFGTWKKKGLRSLIKPMEQAIVTQKTVVNRPNASQTAIKLGWSLFSKTHPDYCAMQILNTVLGGYFGSRLMTNIRERNGYTYNIYSSLDTNMHQGCFYIATEVSAGHGDQVIKEILHEIERLQKRSISKAEMDMVRNYTLGTLLTALDGPVNVSDVLRSYLMEQVPLTMFDTLVETIHTITPRELRDLARKWLPTSDYFEVQVKATQKAE